MKKNWLKRVTVGMCAIIGVVSLAANVVQYRMYYDLKAYYADKTKHLQTVVYENNETIDKKNVEIKSLQYDLQEEKIISNSYKKDLDDLMNVTLKWSKQKAAESGFDPEAYDWIYGGSGLWYFFSYDIDDDATDATDTTGAITVNAE